MSDTFFSQGLSEPARKDALLDLLFVNIGLVGDVMEGSSLGHSDHDMVKVKIFNIMRKSTAGLLLRASGEVTQGATLAEYIFEGLGVQKCWSIFKNRLLHRSRQSHGVVSQASGAEVCLG